MDDYLRDHHEWYLSWMSEVGFFGPSLEKMMADQEEIDDLERMYKLGGSSTQSPT